MDRMLWPIESLPSQETQAGWRLHRRNYDPEFYFRGPARFVPDQSEVGVMYLAPDEVNAAIAFVGDSEVIRSSDLERYILSELQFPSPLRLIDLTSPKIYSMEFPLGGIYSENYAAGQEFATIAFDSGFDGIAFQARAGSRLFAIFGAVGSTRYAKIARDSVIPGEILKKLGVEVLSDPEAGNRWVGTS